MKRFSIFFSVVLLFATMILSSCEKEESPGMSASRYLRSQSPPPDNCFYVEGNNPNAKVADHPMPSGSEIFLKDMITSGGTLTVNPGNSSLWSVTIPEKFQQLEPRGGKAGICLLGFDYFVIPRAECSSANMFRVGMYYNQGQFATGKLLTFDPWIKWGENGELVQAGLQAFADSVYYGLQDIGVPSGYTVCVFATAWDDPSSGNHVYTIHLYVNSVPSSVNIFFQNIFIINCNGVGYANYFPVDLEENIGCSQQPPSCLAIGGTQ